MTQRQRREAAMWRRMAKLMARKKNSFGLCRAAWVDSRRDREDVIRPDVKSVILQAVADMRRDGLTEEEWWFYLSPPMDGPDWDRCLFACLMATVAESGDIDTYRIEDWP